ncbi:MAG TPA: hypothetical protein VHZ74_27090 [Bryobacteraceae bacterium]|nr:hypothetical protein [Bryobacteraceae bacterium]
MTISILALMSALPLRASDEGLPDAPSASQNAAPVSSPRSYYQGAAPAAKGGRFGMDRRVIDRNYLALTGGMFGASVANVALTHRCEAEGTCSFLPYPLSRRAYMLGIGIPADLAVAYVSYRLKKNHNSFWIVPEALVTGANIFVAAHSWSRLK